MFKAWKTWQISRSFYLTRTCVLCLVGWLLFVCFCFECNPSVTPMLTQVFFPYNFYSTGILMGIWKS